MRRLAKILLRIIVIMLVLTLIIFGVRWINTRRYSEYEPTDETSVYTNPSNLALYNTEQEGLTIETLEEGRLNGFHIVPDDLTSQGVVVTFGGSDGSSNYDLALQIANEGYEVYSLFFFGVGDLPQFIQEVPLEFFEEFLAYHEQNSETNGPITVIGASKGAELTLNLSTIYDEIDHIVLYAPSAYNFFSLDQQNANDSSWSYANEPLPYLSNMDGSMFETMKMISSLMLYTPVSYLPVYDSVIEGTDEGRLEEARIKAEEFEGEGLIFAGGDDLMWNSQKMAEKISEYADQLDVHVYPDAGHLFAGMRYMSTGSVIMALGGDTEANAAAFEESNRVLFEKLAQWHGN